MALQGKDHDQEAMLSSMNHILPSRGEGWYCTKVHCWSVSCCFITILNHGEESDEVWNKCLEKMLLWNPMDKQKVTLEGDPTGTADIKAWQWEPAGTKGDLPAGHSEKGKRQTVPRRLCHRVWAVWEQRKLACSLVIAEGCSGCSVEGDLGAWRTTGVGCCDWDQGWGHQS